MKGNMSVKGRQLDKKNSGDTKLHTFGKIPYCLATGIFGGKEFFLLLFYFSFCISLKGVCDEVHLKNGRIMEGIIRKETESLITIDVGCGEITLRKDEIDYIDKYTDNEQAELRKRWSQKYFLHPDFTPSTLRELAEDFKNLERLKKSAIESKEEKESITQKIVKLNKDTEVLSKDLVETSQKLSTAKMEDNRQEYNDLVSEYNSLVAKIQVNNYNIDNLRKPLPDFDVRVSDYTSSLMSFREKVLQTSEAIDAKVTQEERYFLENIRKKIDDMEQDLVQYKVSYNEVGSHVVVRTLLNNSIEVNLMVDTGASLVVISKDTATRLGIDVHGGGFPSGNTILADGRKVKALFITLHSVKVGNAEVKDVQAAVLESVGEQHDGLLGMSFLENFIVAIDGKSKNLILEEFKP